MHCSGSFLGFLSQAWLAGWQGALTGAAGDHHSLAVLARELAAQHSLQLLEVGLSEAQVLRALCWLLSAACVSGHCRHATDRRHAP